MPILVAVRGVAGAATAAAAPEIFSFGHFYSHATSSAEGVPSQSAMDDIAEAARDSAATMLTDTNAQFPSNVFVTEARTYFYPAEGGTPGGGRGDAEVIGYSDAAASPQAGVGTQFVPLQLSVVVSLTTTGRVKPKYGRFYLPPVGLLPGSNGKLDDANTGHIADAAHDFLDRTQDAVQAVLSNLWALSIVTTKRNGLGALAWHYVDEYRVGHVIDTQRRRRNALDESYLSRAWP